MDLTKDYVFVTPQYVCYPQISNVLNFIFGYYIIIGYLKLTLC